jgi:hypothetical protein
MHMTPLVEPSLLSTLKQLRISTRPIRLCSPTGTFIGQRRFCFAKHAKEKFMLEVKDILSDNNLNKSEKIEKLQELLSEARGLQRAATEGGMDADDGFTRNLRDIELALETLNADMPENGPATL